MQKFKQGDRVRFTRRADWVVRLHNNGRTIQGECGTVTVGSKPSSFDPRLMLVCLRWESDGEEDVFDENWLEHAPLNVDAILAAVCDGMKQTN